jgi:hypothetical protein
MDTPKKKPDKIEKGLEDRLSKLEESVLGKLQKASTRALKNTIKEGEARCTSVCPDCLNFCDKDQGHYLTHHCGYCSKYWS